MNGLMGRMPEGSGHHDWLSRDYLDITCHATGCMFNRSGKCGIPSTWAIDFDGKCKGFRSQLPPEKPDGD